MPRAVRLALEALVASFRPLLTAAGVTEQQWRVLRALQEGPASQVELARTCVMHEASLTGVLSRMEHEGLIERRRARVDRRRVLVAASSRGAALVDQLAPAIRQRYEGLAATVGHDTLADLTGAAEAFSRRLSPAATPVKTLRAAS
ncbi:MAG: MarR family transcriptional regulator [Gaiellales bacterium]